LELLNQEGHMAFFELQKGGRKANNAQKEKRRLARKRSRAAKREREREAVKVAHLPTRERQCRGCGRKFASRKTARKHKCPKSNVVRIPREAVEGQVSSTMAPSKPNKPAAPITSHAPTSPPNSTSAPVVTEGSQASAPSGRKVGVNTQTGERRELQSFGEWESLRRSGPWRLERY
jgi:predicted RNA-binding Zn-ribbon protein involved in translation (DUF1610 family)